MWLVLFILCWLTLAVYAPNSVWDADSRAFFIIVGSVGIWRYSWGTVHFIRSLVYRHIVFPKWRSHADRWITSVTPPAFSSSPMSAPHDALAVKGENQSADANETDLETSENSRRTTFSNQGNDNAVVGFPAVHIVITAYRIAGDTTLAVFRAAIEEAANYDGEVTIVASIVEMADQRLIKSVFYKMAPPRSVRLVFVRIHGTGKRAALATALRAVSRMRPSVNSAVVVMDGDTIMPRDCLSRCIPFFAIDREIAGMTTDEDAIVDDRPLMSVWHRLRFAQRHLLMCSMGLSKRLLTMTGRLSVYRASIATHPDFIDLVQNDAMDHWRFGRLPFLTGEDKSTWFWLVEHDQRMLYVPDVRVFTVEHPPAPDFPGATTSLMLRWFGNMLRGSGRAIALGPRRIGFFLWWCLIDQRLSMWTPLIGPLAALSLSIIASPVFLYAYLLWIATTRLIQTLALLTVRDTVSGLYPLLIYYNQVYGALIKTYVLFRLDRQRWTRQNIKLNKYQFAGAAFWHHAVSTYMHILALLSLATLIAFATGLLMLPPLTRFTHDFG